MSDDVSVVGVDIGGTHLDVALSDLSGQVLARRKLPTRADRGPDAVLSTLARLVTELRDLSETAHAKTVMAVAVVSPGIVQADHILLAPNLPSWENVALAQQVRMLTGVHRVAVTNDVKAAALAELRFGALRGVDPGLYLNLGTGLGAAITVGGNVVEGAHNAAGEIGYIHDDDTADGDPMRPVLEEAVGGKALGERASTALGVPLDSAALFARRDPDAARIVQSALTRLARAISGLCVALDPARVVVGGGMMASADVIVPVLRSHLTHLVPFTPELRPAQFLQDASLHGAVALAIDALTTDPRPAATPSAPPVPVSARSNGRQL